MPELFKSPRVVWCLLFALIALMPPVRGAGVIASSFRIAVTVSPTQVQVGHYVTVRVRANSPWPAHSSVSVVLSSPHHYIDTPATWSAGCSCFSVPIRLIPRVHPPEAARVTATATVSDSTYRAVATTKIYGLYPNGKPEPIATPKKRPEHALHLSEWVYPKRPVAGQYSTVWVETLPGATCTARVTFVGGKVPSQFDGSPSETDGVGQANWTWFNDVTSSTTGNAVVTCDRESLDGRGATQFHVRR